LHLDPVRVGTELASRAWTAGVGAECGSDVSVVLATEEGQDEGAAGSHELRSATGADGGAVFIEGDIPDIVQAM
jgi:hypothetical protein